MKPNTTHSHQIGQTSRLVHASRNGALIKMLAACLSVMAASSALATTYTWTNSAGTSLSLNASTNWSPNGVPSSGAGDTMVWNGTAAGNLDLVMTADITGNPGVFASLTSGQTGYVTITNNAANRAIRFNQGNSLSIASGAGALTFGAGGGSPAFPFQIALGVGNGAVHNWTNNSANPVTINTNVYFVMGGGGSHTLNTAGAGNFVFNNTIQPNNGANLNLTVNGPGSVTVMGTYAPGVSWAAGSAYAQTILNGGTLICGGNNSIATNNFTINGGSLDSVTANLTNILIASQNWNTNFTFIGSQSLDLGAGPVTMNANRIVTVNASTLQVDGVISGSGFSLTKAGAGTMVLGGANGYSGGTVISNGVLKMANAGALGTNTANLTVHGTLDLNGNSLTVRNLNGNATGVIDDVAGSGSDALVVSNSTSSTFAGVIKNTTGAVSLTKADNGTLTLSGANTYSGNTAVNAGTLLVNGTIGSGTVTVASGASLGGTGTVGGAVNWQSLSSALFTVTPTTGAGSNSTPLTVSGSVTLNGNTVTVNVPGGTPLGVGTYTLMSYNSSGSSGAFSSLASYTGAGAEAGTYSTISTSGGTVTVTVALTGISATWTNNANGNWSDGTSWDSNPDYPHVSGDAATLGVGSAFATVTMDTNVSLAAMTFTNANSFQVADAGHTLDFTNITGGGDALINVLAGASNAISAAVQLDKNLTIQPVSGTALAFTNTISNGSSTKALTVNGAGTVQLSGNNSYGPSAGTVGTTFGGGGVLLLGNNSALGAGDLSLSSSSTIRAGAALSLANNILANSGVTASVDDNGNNVTLSGVISGTGALGKNGAGTVSLSGANSFAGGASISAGTVKLLNANGLSTNGNINMGAGTTLDLNGFSPVFGALNSSFSNAVVDTLSGGSVTLTVGQTNAFGTFAGSIQNSSGSLALVKAGTGIQTLTGTNTYTGGTTITAGTLQIGNGGTTGSLGSSPVVNNGNLAFNLTGTNIFASQITSTGAVSLANSGLVLHLNGNNTFTGPINITFGGGGALWITNASALGVGPKLVVCNSGNNSLHLDGSSGNINVDGSISFQLSNGSGVLYNEGGSNTIAGSIGMVNGNGNSLVVVNSGFLTLAGSVATVTGNNPRTLILGGAGNGLVSGAITNGGTVVCTVIKQDAGTWTLSGNDTYTGGATVSGGTLLINGNNSSSVTVASGATLGGTGTIGGSATWQAGSMGAFTTSTAGSTPLSVSGSVTLNTNNLTIFVAGGTPLPAGTYTLLSSSSTISGSFASAPTFTGAGIGPTTVAVVTTSSSQVLLVVANRSVWTNNNNGNWTTGANWDSNPSYPNSAGETAILGVGSVLTTINLDASETVGGIFFTNDNSFVITNTANVLAMDNNGNGAVINVTGGTNNTIATGVSVNDGLLTTINVAAQKVLSIPGTMTGFGTLALTGNGVLALSGPNNGFSTFVNVNGGTLMLGSTNALGSCVLTMAGGGLDSSITNMQLTGDVYQNWNGSFTFVGSQNLNLGTAPVTLNTNVTITVVTNTLTEGGPISGSFILTMAGNGTLELDATNTMSGVTITGGALALGDNNAMGTGTINLSGNNVIIRSKDGTARTFANNVSANTFDGPSIMGGTADLTFSGTVACGSFQKRFVISNSVTTFSGPFTGGTSQNQANIKDGPGTLILSADNSALAKFIEVRQGTLALGSATAIGTGALTMTGGGLDSTVASLVNAGNNPQVWNGSFYFAGSQSLNMGTGAVTMNAATTVTVSNNTFTVGGGVGGSGALTKAGAGTLVLAGTNAYAGNTTVGAGTLEIAQATLATNSTVSISSGAVLQLDFSGTNTVAGLILNGSTQSAGVYGSSTPGGYIAGTGSLKVVPLGPSGPGSITNSVSGSTLSLSWPAGQGWRLQIQTNSLAAGLGTNWTYLTDGSVSSTNITIDASAPAAFYRLTYP